MKIRPTKFLLGLCLAVICGFLQLQAAQRRMTAVITSAQGKVQVKTAITSEWEKAEKGMECYESAKIKTGPTGSAEVVFNDGTALKIEKNSFITIQKSRQKRTFREFVFDLFNGRVLSNVKKKNKHGKAKFYMNTPLCAGAVRGTVFVVDHSSDTTHLAVYDGAVEAQAVNGQGSDSVKVRENTQTKVLSGQALEKPSGLSAEFADYRKNIAELFNRRVEGYRKNMEKVRRMNKEFMEKRQMKNKNQLQNRQNKYKDLMQKRAPQNSPAVPPEMQIHPDMDTEDR